MPPSLALHTLCSRSELMHSALAHRSVEVETLRDIIASPPESKHATTPRIPLELLLLIQDFLIPTITAGYITETITSLRLYETRMRRLLCPECTIYNFEIYGPDVWHWEQLTGVCACQNTSTQQDTTTPKRNQDLSIQTAQQRFPTPAHWLEDYLSHKASAQIETRGLPPSHPSVSEDIRYPTRPRTNIWDVVTEVLYEFNCGISSGDSHSLMTRHTTTPADANLSAIGGTRAAAHAAARSSSLSKGYSITVGRGLSELSNDDLISIVALPNSQFSPQIPSPPGSFDASSGGVVGSSASCRRNRVVLNRMRKRLGLGWEYPEVFSTDHLQPLADAILSQQRRERKQREHEHLLRSRIVKVISVTLVVLLYLFLSFRCCFRAFCSNLFFAELSEMTPVPGN